MANETTNVTANENVNEAAQAPQEAAKEGFRLPTKEQVISGAKKAGNVVLKVCSITATVGAGIFGAMVIGATAKELLGPKTGTDSAEALPEVELPTVEAVTEEIVSEETTTTE